MVNTLPAADPLRRRLLAGALGGTLVGTFGATLGGCAAVDDLPAPAALQAADTIQPAGGGAPAPGTPLLTPWLSVNGGWRTAAAGSGPQVMPNTPLQRLLLQQPMGVAARAGRVVLYDAGLRLLLRWDRTLDQMTPLAAAGSVGAPLSGDHAMGLLLGDDASVWVAEPLTAQVLQLDTQGRVRRTLRDARLLARPVGVSQAPGAQDLQVADAAEARVVVFSTFGQPLTRWGDGVLQSISAIAHGPQGLVVLDRLAQQVVVFAPNGKAIASFGDDSLLQPRALAVDMHGRVYVGDDGDQRIKVFGNGERLASFGGPGNGAGRFGRIDAMAADGGQLYVADSVNGRVQVLLIAPPSLRGGR